MNLLSISNLSVEDVRRIFKLTDQVKSQSYSSLLKGKTFVLFFPQTSLRTRIAFERGIKLLGGDCILFPPETLEKKEALEDVIQYLNNWVDGVIVRCKSYAKLVELSSFSSAPVINAMTAYNHPCEILSDLYSISRLKPNYQELTYTFVGENSNICKSWVNISKVMGLNFNHVCLPEYEMKDMGNHYSFTPNLDSILLMSDIVLTDALPTALRTTDYINDYQITLERMNKTKKGSILNPCPPFSRGEEVSKDVIDSDYFVGYRFKEKLLYVKQAIILYCLGIDLTE